MASLVRLIRKTYRMVDPLEGKRVMHNVASLSWLQAITYVLPLIILPYLFRIIGPERFGLVAFAQAFVQYFIILTDYGFSVSATKEISLCHEDNARVSRVFSAVMTVKIALALLSFLVLSGIVYFVPKFRDDWMVYVLSFGAVAGGAIFPVWFFQGVERMRYIARLNIVGEFAFVFCILLFVRGPEDYLKVPLVGSSVLLITGLAAQYILWSKFGMSFRWPEYKDIRRQLKAGWDVFISVVAINAYTTTRVFAVGLLTNNTLTGFYSVAERISGAIQTFPLSSFSQAIFPRLSKIFHKNKAKAFEIMRHIQLITIVISLICLPVFFLLAPLIVKLVCGGTYPAAVLSLRFLLVSVFFISSNAFRVQFLLVCGRTDIYSKIHVSMAMIGLPLIIIFIYAFSYAGAAIATAAIEAGVFTITYFTVKKLKF
ncbi:MAG: flippase [Candidatus Omnitrophica bacterium]|nr:flippase [Candidatus Omnitrophota bacterium]